VKCGVTDGTETVLSPDKFYSARLMSGSFPVEEQFVRICYTCILVQVNDLSDGLLEGKLQNGVHHSSKVWQ